MVILEDEDGHRCDERCYNARRIGCHCICGGKNHGLGLEHALQHQGDEVVEQASDDEESDLGIYGDSAREQEEGARYERSIGIRK